MGLDITFYKRSKLDPRYKEEVGYFGKVNCILTYFGIEDNDNCSSVVIPKEKFEQFIDDLKKELGSHKGIHLPTEWNDHTCIKQNNEKFNTMPVFFGGSLEYDGSYWNNIRSLYRWAVNLIKNNEVDFDSDDLMIVCWWQKFKIDDRDMNYDMPMIINSKVSKRNC